MTLPTSGNILFSAENELTLVSVVSFSRWIWSIPAEDMLCSAIWSYRSLHTKVRWHGCCIKSATCHRERKNNCLFIVYEHVEEDSGDKKKCCSYLVNKEVWQSDVPSLRTSIRLKFESSERLEKEKESQVSFFLYPFMTLKYFVKQYNI